jgi:hypothetical protein
MSASQTVAQLREIAKSLNLTGYSKLKKAELIELIEKNKNKDIDIKMNDDTVYYGTKKCDKCNKNKAYWFTNKGYYCGVCSRSIKDRVELPKNEQIKQQLRDAELATHNQSILDKMTYNAERKLEGIVIMTKMYMMKDPDLIPGVLNIFPNYKHGNRKDGLGMPSLSPKWMGPIKHNQSGLPEAKSLENMFQYNKCFSNEVDELGNIKQEFFNTQIKGYLDETPHRHKPNASGNVPLFSVWKDKKGKIYRLSYIESRQIYCHYYMLFAVANENFIKLKALVKSGYNINICGYDAYTVEMGNKNIDEYVEEKYLDPSKPFGHEIVLFALLLCKNVFPWIKYKTLDL